MAINQSINHSGVSQGILHRFVVIVQVAQGAFLFFSVKCTLSRLANFLGIACAGSSCWFRVVFRKQDEVSCCPGLCSVQLSGYFNYFNSD